MEREIILESNNLSSEDITILKTPEDVEEICKLANLKIEDIENLAQVLYSDELLEVEANDFKMMEVDDHILKSLSNGDSVTFRGDPDEPVVLCTATRTYEVREAETSNTCLLVPDLNSKKDITNRIVDNITVENKQVTGTFNTYYELREISPKLDKMLTILEPSSFKGMEYESMIDRDSFYDWERLTNEVQASDGEILSALTDFLIAEMDGKYRLIAFEFEARALPLMFDLIEENSWQLDEIDKEESYESLAEIIPKPVFELLFQKYATLSSKTKKDNSPLYEYNVPKSTRLLAQILLSASTLNNYDAFMEAWKMGCPPSMKPKEEHLYGVAIVTWNDQTKKKSLMFFPETHLPDNLLKRLDELFKVKSKWTLQEITPYLSKFATRTQDVNALLTKYTRSSTKNGIKYYSSKHGK